MANDNVNEKLTALADEIRELSGTADKLGIDEMASALDTENTNFNTNLTAQDNLIEQIKSALAGKAAGSGGIVLPTLDNPASASDILANKEAINGVGNKIVGTIATKTSNDVGVNGATITVPAGYYASETIKSVTSTTQATPSVNIDATGKITATAAQTAGYVSAGTKTAEKQLTTQAAKTITPTKSAQTAVPSGVYTTGTVTVGAIPSEYIVTTDATATVEDIMLDKTAYVKGEKITGVFTLEEELTTQDDLITQLQNMVESLPEAGGAELELQNKTVTPTTTTQSIKADSGYDGLDTVTVNAIPSTYIKPVATKTATTYTPATSDQVIAAGTYCSGAQTIKGDANLIAENIVSGKSIFGIVGSAITGGGGSEPKMIAVTHIHTSAAAKVYCFNSSYELITIDRDSTVDALGGIVLYFGHLMLDAVSGDYIKYQTSMDVCQIIRFNANSGTCIVYNGGGGSN